MPHVGIGTRKQASEDLRLRPRGTCVDRTTTINNLIEHSHPPKYDSETSKNYYSTFLPLKMNTPPGLKSRVPGTNWRSVVSQTNGIFSDVAAKTSKQFYFL
jgi:hypothetical protein